MKMKLWIYEIHIFELQNEEINVKKILAVIKGKPDFFRLSFYYVDKSVFAQE